MLKENAFTQPQAKHMKILHDIIPEGKSQDGKTRLELPGLGFDLLPEIRAIIADHLEKKDIGRAEINRIILSATEILSNLIQHPKTPANSIIISFYLKDRDIELDIADNSTPFENFDTKCKESLTNIKNRSFKTSGRGLGMIALQHPDHSYIPASLSDDGLNHFRLSDSPSPADLALKELEQRFTNTKKDQVQKLSVKKTPAPQKDTNSPKSTGKPEIFVIDDEDLLRDLLTRILTKDYKVQCFSNAADALEAFRKQPPDLIISDLYMPGMSGADLREALKNEPEGDSTPFIFLSGDKEAADNPYLNRIGIDDFLFKPVKKDQILRVVDRLISRSSQIKNHINGTIGQDITSILRPDLPEQLGPWACHVRNDVASVGGGDFILHHQTLEGTLIVLADVMGHGMEAKFFAYAYAGYLRSLFKTLQDTTRPDRFLRKLSDAVQDDSFLESRIITCLGLWLSNTGVAQIASAGHPAPLLSETESPGQQTEIAGPLPGLVGKSKYRLWEKQLKQGDRLVLFTDGLIEVKNQAGFSIQQYLEILDKHKDTESQLITDMFWQSYVEKNDNKEARDDATLIIIELNRETNA